MSNTLLLTWVKTLSQAMSAPPPPPLHTLHHRHHHTHKFSHSMFLHIFLPFFFGSLLGLLSSHFSVLFRFFFCIVLICRFCTKKCVSQSTDSQSRYKKMCTCSSLICSCCFYPVFFPWSVRGVVLFFLLILDMFLTFSLPWVNVISTLTIISSLTV